MVGATLIDQDYGGVRPWGYLQAALGAGTVIGGLLANRLRIRRIPMVAVAGVGSFGLVNIVLAERLPLGLLLFCAICGGIGLAVGDVFWSVTLHHSGCCSCPCFRPRWGARRSRSQPGQSPGRGCWRSGWLPRSGGWSARNRRASPSQQTAVLPETLLSCQPGCQDSVLVKFLVAPESSAPSDFGIKAVACGSL